jgi:hypothetical protein
VDPPDPVDTSGEVSMRFVRLIILALTLGLLTVLVPAGAASAQEITRLAIGDSATLLANGAAVRVPVTVMCSGGRGDVGVSVAQRRGREVIRGSGGAALTCDGRARTYNVVVFADFRPFKVGEAVAFASVFICSEFDCVFASTSEVIQIRR